MVLNLLHEYRASYESSKINLLLEDKCYFQYKVYGESQNLSSHNLPRNNAEGSKFGGLLHLHIDYT